MPDPMDTLKSILGDDAEDKIRNVMGSLSSGSGGAGNSGDFNAENLEYAMQLRELMSKITNSSNDTRANLLMSLKPYMRDNRKRSIDSAIKLLNISKLAGMFRL